MRNKSDKHENNLHPHGCTYYLYYRTKRKHVLSLMVYVMLYHERRHIHVRNAGVESLAGRLPRNFTQGNVSAPPNCFLRQAPWGKAEFRPRGGCMTWFVAYADVNDCRWIPFRECRTILRGRQLAQNAVRCLPRRRSPRPL